MQSNTLHNVKLSSRRTDVQIIVLIFLLWLIVPVCVAQYESSGLTIVFALLTTFIAVTTFLLIYLLLYAVRAVIMNNELVLKKKFRPERRFPLTAIHNISTSRWRSTKYITLRMKNEDGGVEKFLIVNGPSLFSTTYTDASELLLSIKLSNRRR